jgi:hypothetical protein
MEPLDDPCDRFLNFRQIIECGETQARTGLSTLPRQAETWNVLDQHAACELNRRNPSVSIS